MYRADSVTIPNLRQCSNVSVNSNYMTLNKKSSKISRKYHSDILSQIDRLQRPKWCKLYKEKSDLNNVKAFIKPNRNQFKLDFFYDIFSPRGKKLDVGQYHKKVEIKFGNSVFIARNIFLGNSSSSKLTGYVDRLSTKGYSEQTNYYYKLVVPLEKELNFHFVVDQVPFSTDLGYLSRSSTIAKIDGETIQICCVNRKRKEYFLIIDSPIKQSFKSFSEKSSAVRIALGYLSGYYAGNQGYFFAYTKKNSQTSKHLHFAQFRSSIKSGYTPLCSNAHTYLHRNKTAAKYKGLLRTVSLKEFSILSERVYNLQNFSSAMILLLEASVASLLFMPGGFAIVLETLSDLIIGKNKPKLSPIPDKSLSKKIRKEFINILNSHSSSFTPETIKILHTRIDQFNQTTNKSRLKAPFDILKIDLTPEDIQILETRNDFLHGRIPDITNSGGNRTLERTNKDLYYASVRFYTLVNALILKWVGYDNRIVNFPKLHEKFTKIKLKEEYFRQI